MAEVFDLSRIKYVKRIVVGQKDPQVLYTEEDAAKDMELLNKCLNEFPKGHIIGQEKNFTIKYKAIIIEDRNLVTDCI